MLKVMVNSGPKFGSVKRFEAAIEQCKKDFGEEIQLVLTRTRGVNRIARKSSLPAIRAKGHYEAILAADIMLNFLGDRDFGAVLIKRGDARSAALWELAEKATALFASEQRTV